GNELSHRYLAPKSKSLDVVSLQKPPQQSFGASHPLPKLLGTTALTLGDLCVRHLTPPSPPSPTRGEGAGCVSAASQTASPRDSITHELNPPAKVGQSSGRKP